MTAARMPMPNSPASQVLVDSDSPSSPYFTQNPECIECDDYELDTEELRSSDGNEDATKDIYDDFDYTPAWQRQCDEYANSALKHYNNDHKNVVKYELVKAVASCGIMNGGFYGHVNFTAKSTLENSKEEFFFAELRWNNDTRAMVPTCMVSLEGKERVGGLSETKISNSMDGMNLRVDTQHCYACGEDLKHPEDGTLYETGHIAMNGCYGYDD